jgi:hypothetical protein
MVDKQQIPELDPDVMKVVKELENILNIKFKSREWNPTTALFAMTHLKQQHQEAKDAEAKKEAPEIPSSM